MNLFVYYKKNWINSRVFQTKSSETAQSKTQLSIIYYIIQIIFVNILLNIRGIEAILEIVFFILK